jgi:hypothetical protein
MMDIPVWGFLKKLKTELPYDPNSILEQLSKGM